MADNRCLFRYKASGNNILTPLPTFKLVFFISTTTKTFELRNEWFSKTSENRRKWHEQRWRFSRIRWDGCQGDIVGDWKRGELKMADESSSSLPPKRRRFALDSDVVPRAQQEFIFTGLFAEAKRLNDGSNSSSKSRERAVIDTEGSCTFSGGVYSFLGFDGDLAKTLNLSKLELERRKKKSATCLDDAPDCLVPGLVATVVDSERFVRELTVDTSKPYLRVQGGVASGRSRGRNIDSKLGSWESRDLRQEPWNAADLSTGEIGPLPRANLTLMITIKTFMLALPLLRLL